jgi:demethoxyubiquinone hydroxylase (CLK1/Coq7/Cat5 family)
MKMKANPPPIIPKNKTSFDSFKDRIRLAQTSEEVLAIERRVERHYNMGLLSMKDLDRLDEQIIRRLIKLEEVEPAADKGQEQ